MVSGIAQGRNYAQVTATTTLGYGVGQTTPPLLLTCNNAGFTVVLPPTSTFTPPPPTIGQTTVGANGGFRITVMQLAASGTVTVAPAGTDVIVGQATVGTQNAALTYQSVPESGTWYIVAKA